MTSETVGFGTGSADTTFRLLVGLKSKREHDAKQSQIGFHVGFPSRGAQHPEKE